MSRENVMSAWSGSQARAGKVVRQRTRRVAWRLLALGVVLVLLLVPSTAAADAAYERAKEYYSAGVEAYRAGAYLAAAEAFEKSHARHPRPAIVFSMAQAYRRHFFATDEPRFLQRAIAGYRRYLSEVANGKRRADAVRSLSELVPLAARLDPEPVAAHRAPQATRLLVSARPANAIVILDGETSAQQPLVRTVKPGKHTAEVRAAGYEPQRRDVEAIEGELVAIDTVLTPRPASVWIEGADGVEVNIDGRSMTSLPMGQVILLDAGRHTLTLSERGHYPHREQLDLGPGSRVEVTAELAATTQRRTAWTLLGAGLAGIAAGSISGGLALGAQSDALDIEAERGSAGVITAAQLVAHNEAIDRRDDLRLAAGLGLGFGAGLGLVGGLLYALDNPAPPAESSPARLDESQEPTEPEDLDVLGGFRRGGFTVGVRARF